MVVVIKRGMSRERIKALMGKLRRSERKREKAIDVYKYLGVLRVDEDPIALQRKWRDEWG